MPAIAVALLLGAAVQVDAPIAEVTVFSAGARIVRRAHLDIRGVRAIELPQLPAAADEASIQLEAIGAEVRRVELGEVVQTAERKPDQARLRSLDERIAATRAEREARASVLDALAAAQPAIQDEDGPGQRVALVAGVAERWAAALRFLRGRREKLSREMRAAERRLRDLQSAREQLEQAAHSEAQRAQPRRAVVATLAGDGPVELRLSYFVSAARWKPRYDVQLLPALSRARIALAGDVEQETGEDWREVALTLSTALPARAVQVPELLAWRIGDSQLFVPAARIAPEASAQNTYDRFASAPRLAGSGGIQGQILDAVTQLGLKDAVVIAQSPSLSGEQSVATSSDGTFAINSLPSGTYSLTIQREAYQPFAQQGLTVSGDRTIRVKLQLIPDSFRGEQVEIVAQKPTLSMNHAETGRTIGNQEMSLMPGGPLPGGGSGRVLAWLVEKSQPTLGVAISAPAAEAEPIPAADSAAALAGGYDVVFSALQPETVKTGQPARGVALFSETWPVETERALFPGIASEAYLLAALKNPSQRVLPGGPASLAVGADPAGTARLSLAVPGESFTLPLGVDRGVRAARNVRTVTAEKGFIGKDDLTEYTVSIEVANPHAETIAVRVVDQWPLAGEGVKAQLLRAQPAPLRREDETGRLEWRFSLPPSSKQTLQFTYTLRRPRGWRLAQ
jgi:hypothetical protein